MDKYLISVSALLLSVYTFAGSSSRPNIIFLLSDDQRWDSPGCLGNKTVKTPEIDRLAQEGIRFTNSFVTFSVSAASRAVILTGMYSRSRSNGADDLPAICTPENWENTFPALLKKNGYYTGYIGKWDIGVGEVGFQHGMNLFDYWGGDRWHGNYWHEKDCNFVNNDGIAHKKEIRCTCVTRNAWDASLPRTGNQNIKNPLHTDSEVVPLKVNTFLESRDKQKPFFLQVSFRSPKDPWSDNPTEVKDYYTDDSIAISPTANLQNAFLQPEFLQKSMAANHARNLLGRKGLLENEIRKHYRLVTGIDIAIGKLRKILTEQGIEDNTIIVFASDNGTFLGEHGFWGKWLPYEESMRVPLIIYDPRIKKENGGKTVDEMVLNVDYAPTFLAFAGIKTPRYMHGMDIGKLMANEKSNWRTDWYYEHSWTAKSIGSNVTSIVPSEAVRTNEWKYILFTNQQVEQLFNIKNDPFETVDLIANPSNKKMLDKLRGRMNYYRKLYEKK